MTMLVNARACLGGEVSWRETGETVGALVVQSVAVLVIVVEPGLITRPTSETRVQISGCVDCQTPHKNHH